MANNLVVSYDLHKPEQNYDAVQDRIKSLGAWARVQRSVWYVKSAVSASDAVTHIWAAMDANDSLIVFDLANNTAAWMNLDPQVSQFLQQQWFA